MFRLNDRVLHAKSGRVYRIVDLPTRLRIEAGMVPAYSYVLDQYPIGRLANDTTLWASLFQKPMLEAKVIVPADRVTPQVLDATVIENVREALQQQLGMSIEIALVEPERKA